MQDAYPREGPGRLLGYAAAGRFFFKDFWRCANETTAGRSGDHIDLWNGRRLTDWMSYVRIQMGFSIDGTFSDFHDSKDIWFWRVI
nr:T6SS effector amidase Tae4 family protein [Pseudomonas sp. FW300-N2E2]